MTASYKRGLTLFVVVAALTLTGCLSRVSVDENGNAISGGEPSISADGRFVAFTGATGNVYVRDLSGSTTAVVSVGIGGVNANGPSAQPAISADGRYVAFASTASNLVPGDTNGSSDVFVRDLTAQTTERVSVASDGTQANGPSDQPDISRDGNVVVFVTTGSTIVHTYTDVAVRDRSAGTTGAASDGACGDGPNSDLASPAVSGDGRFVAFLVTCAGDEPDPTFRVMEYDRNAGTYATRASELVYKSYGVSRFNRPRYSDDANTLVWTADGFSAGGYAWARLDLFDRVARGYNGTSTSLAGALRQGTFADVSADGRFVTTTVGWKIAPSHWSGQEVQVVDRSTGRVAIASSGNNGTHLGGGDAVISDDGTQVAFTSSGAVFRRDTEGATTVPSRVAYSWGATVTEPATGTTTVNVHVDLFDSSDVPASVAWHTVDGSAKAPDDYDAVTAGTAAVTFDWGPGPAGSVDLPVTVRSDPTSEGTETFTIVIDGPPAFAGLGPITVTIR
jgi:Tol biopolymer transport system component